VNNKILVVEQEDSWRELYRLSALYVSDMEDLSANIETQESIDTVIASLTQEHFEEYNLLIVGNGREGIELIKKIRATGSTVPVIYMANLPDWSAEALKVGGEENTKSIVRMGYANRHVHRDVKYFLEKKAQ
jgi:DNA-binding NtrC family response regulator